MFYGVLMTDIAQRTTLSHHQKAHHHDNDDYRRFAHFPLDPFYHTLLVCPTR
jgi:hypothetical protein